MGYESMDALIGEWTRENGLHLATSYKDEEVRSVEVVGESGRGCQIWIDAPDSRHLVGVHVWDYKQRRRDFEVDKSLLLDALNQALTIARNWVL